VSNSNIWFQVVAFNEPFGYLLYYVLQAGGHAAGLTIGNLSDFVEKIRRESPDVLVVELDQDGYWVVALERLLSQADTAAVPIIAVATDPTLLALASKSFGIRFTLRAPWNLKEAFALFSEIAAEVGGAPGTKAAHHSRRELPTPSVSQLPRHKDVR